MFITTLNVIAGCGASEKGGVTTLAAFQRAYELGVDA